MTPAEVRSQCLSCANRFVLERTLRVKDGYGMRPKFRRSKGLLDTIHKRTIPEFLGIRLRKILDGVPLHAGNEFLKDGLAQQLQRQQPLLQNKVVIRLLIEGGAQSQFGLCTQCL